MNRNCKQKHMETLYVHVRSSDLFMLLISTQMKIIGFRQTKLMFTSDQGFFIFVCKL